MKTTCYIQVEPEWASWDRDKLYGIAAKRVTQKKPTSPIPGCVVVKLTLDIADAAFLPVQPQVEVMIPVDHTEAVQVVSEPVEVLRETEEAIA